MCQAIQVGKFSDNIFIKMDKLKRKFEDQEKAHRDEFEDFLGKNYESNFMSNLLIVRMRAY